MFAASFFVITTHASGVPTLGLTKATRLSATPPLRASGIDGGATRRSFQAARTANARTGRARILSPTFLSVCRCDAARAPKTNAFPRPAENNWTCTITVLVLLATICHESRAGGVYRQMAPACL